MEFPPSDRRTNLRSPILVTQVKMGDDRKYFFGYAKNVSRSGIFIQTIAPRSVGEDFTVEFSIPKTDIHVKCMCRVIWSRRFSESGKKEPGMGLHFLDLDPAIAEKVHDWVSHQLENPEP